MRKRNLLVSVLLIVVMVDAFFIASSSSHVGEASYVPGGRALNAGLIAHYAFNNGTGEVLYDHSLHGFNGTITGAVWSAGRWSRGLYFGGAGDYVDIRDVGAYIYTNSVKSVALTAWVNYTATGNLQIIGDADEHIYAELQVETNGTVHFWMEDGSDADYMVWSNSPLNDGKWHFIVGQYNYTTKVMEIWVDGVLNQRKTYTFEPSAPGNYYIGHGDNDDFNGSIDEVRIYERTLSAGEIAFLYNYSDVHEPVRINSDSEFASFIENEHLAGDGSEANPYEISGYDIDANGSGNAIYIGNTTVHFVVDECHLHSASHLSAPYLYGAGITLYNVSNGTVSKVRAEDEYSGIFMRDSGNVTCEGNFIRNVTYGIDAEGYHREARNVTLSGNAVELAQEAGVYVYWAENITVDNNTLMNSPDAYGFLLYYMYHSTVANNTIDNAACGISMADTSYNTYRGNVINNTSEDGIYFDEDCYSELLEENRITNTTEGIEMYGDDYITFEKNYIETESGGFLTGIDIDGDYLVLYENTFVNCGIEPSDMDTLTMPANNTVNSKPVVFYKNTNLNNATINNAGQVILYNVSWVNIEALSMVNVPYGIYGYETNNITIHNVTVLNSYVGMRIRSSMDILINQSVVLNASDYGIHLELSSNSEIINSRVARFSDDGIYIDQSDHTTVEGNEVERSRNGMWITGDYNYIANNSILNSSHYGIRISHYHNTITGNVIVNSTDYGIYINNGYSGNMIYGNYFYRNHGSNDTYNSSTVQAIDLGSNYWNSSTEGNYWYDWVWPDEDWNGIVEQPYSLGGGKDYRPIARAPHRPIVIHNESEMKNYAREDWWPGNGSASNPYIISGYDINASGTVGIYIGNVTSHFIIKYSEVHNVRSGGYCNGTAIYLESAGNGTVKNNYLHDFNYGMTIYSHNKNLANDVVENRINATGALYGVYLHQAPGNLIENNTIYGSSGYGVYLLGSYYNEVKFNTIYENAQDGVHAEFSLGSSYVGNNITNNGQDGIYVGYTDWGSIENNSITDNGRYGLKIHADELTVSYNYIANNTGYGVYLTVGGNLFYNNSFYFNNGSNGTYNASHVQAYDSGGNRWNITGNPGRGNYWYDWASNNNSNDVNPHDGIVDWSYKIDGGAGAEDHYPIANVNSSVPELDVYAALIILVFPLLLRRKR